MNLEELAKEIDYVNNIEQYISGCYRNYSNERLINFLYNLDLSEDELIFLKDNTKCIDDNVLKGVNNLQIIKNKNDNKLNSSVIKKENFYNLEYSDILEHIKLEVQKRCTDDIKIDSITFKLDDFSSNILLNIETGEEFDLASICCKYTYNNESYNIKSPEFSKKCNGTFLSDFYFKNDAYYMIEKITNSIFEDVKEYCLLKYSPSFDVLKDKYKALELTNDQLEFLENNCSVTQIYNSKEELLRDDLQGFINNNEINSLIDCVVDIVLNGKDYMKEISNHPNITEIIVDGKTKFICSENNVKTLLNELENGREL